MIIVLGDQHLRQQAVSRDGFVDYLCRYRGLDRRFAVLTDPLATDMALDGEHGRRVIELFADIFADPLKRTAAGALGVLPLQVNQGAGELRWQSGV